MRAVVGAEIERPHGTVVVVVPWPVVVGVVSVVVRPRWSCVEARWWSSAAQWWPAPPSWSARWSAVAVVAGRRRRSPARSWSARWWCAAVVVRCRGGSSPGGGGRRTRRSGRCGSVRPAGGVPPPLEPLSVSTIATAPPATSSSGRGRGDRHDRRLPAARRRRAEHLRSPRLLGARRRREQRRRLAAVAQAGAARRRRPAGPPGPSRATQRRCPRAPRARRAARLRRTAAGSSRCMRTSSIAFVETNGSAPVSIRKRMTPNE